MVKVFSKMFFLLRLLKENLDIPKTMAYKLVIKAPYGKCFIKNISQLVSVEITRPFVLNISKLAKKYDIF